MSLDALLGPSIFFFFFIICFVSSLSFISIAVTREHINKML